MFNFKVNFNHSEFDGEVHPCVGRKEGSSYIYECPICDYRVVFVEKEDGNSTMKKTGGNPNVRHTGSYTSPLALNRCDN